jgi:molybdopterin-guanine dinucleotide biosynthesis protein A
MGQAKAWLPFGDEFLLQRVTRVVGEAVEPVVVVAAAYQEIPKLPAEVLRADDESEGRGPLQGFVTGLRALEGRVEAAYLSSCDVPFLLPAFIKRMVRLLQDARTGTLQTNRPEVAVPRVGGRLHPLAAVYCTSVLPRLQEFLDLNQLRMTSLFDTLPTRVVEAHELADLDPRLQSLRNLNTPEEYAAALEALGSLRSN